MTDQAQAPEVVDLSKYIETRYFDDRPHIRGRRVPVAIVAYNARTNNLSLAELAYEFTLTEAEVSAALLYYQEHQAEIDAQEKREIELFDEKYRQQHGED
jgi:uncharacterized protein (DUF433 family)